MIVNKEMYDLVCTSFKRERPDGNSVFIRRSEFFDDDFDRVIDAFSNKDWHELIDDDLECLVGLFKFPVSLAYFSLEGFLYYLPAFFVYCSSVEDYDTLEKLYFRISLGDNGGFEEISRLQMALSSLEVETMKKALLIIDSVWSLWGVSDNYGKLCYEEYWKFL